MDSLVVFNGQVYLTDIAVAEWFVEQYYAEVINYFYDPLNVYSHEILAEAMRLALKQNTITVTDFQLTDAELLEKLKQNSDAMAKIQLLWSNVCLEENNLDYIFHHKKKTRLINPSVLLDGKLIPAADISEKVQQMNLKARKKSESGFYLKVIEKKSI